MGGVIQLILFAGMCVIVVGVGPRVSGEKSRSGGTFLDALLTMLNKNSSEKVMQRVDSATRRSTC
jgi:hypothetical protein